MTKMNSIRILRLPEVVKKTGLSRSSIYQMATVGSFPSSVPLGGRSVGWIEAEIESWLSERIQRREAVRAKKEEKWNK